MQAEADADTDSTRQHRKRRQVDTNALHRDRDGENDESDTQNLAEQDAQRGRQFVDLLNAIVEEVADFQREPEQATDKHNGLQHQQERNAGVAQAESHAVQDLRYVIDDVEYQRSGENPHD